ncbi:hypothetical protein SLNSH_08035 [Alsobacter soli]|uniref:Caspase family p20 domain-containing protein n=1 Tax=Alsobacter soli TaxID=2109933 RepID=A0A2T1HVH7_9HYPH|nr:peptidoglycan-binding domain-containing protein [Alsobacter soli]PSC05529.1 hypothetical protein SLNSH_08035 [Alsobacter soli]
MISSACLVAVLALCGVMFGTARAHAAGKIALVLAAEDYDKLPKSTVGVKRATALADALTARGFDVALSANPSNAAARAALRELQSKAEAADIALVFVIGHTATWAGQTFFLSKNSEIGRATDLLSRGLSVPTIAQIASHAKTAAVFVLPTTPDFGSIIEGLEARPQFSASLPSNTVAVLSSSARAPVSRIDALSEQAADGLAKVLSQSEVSLAQAVRAGANGDLGIVVGTPPDVSLSRPIPPKAPPFQPASLTSRQSDPDPAAAARLEAERQAREVAERKAREEASRVEQAKAETEAARADVVRAQAEARKAQADAERAQADAAKAQADAERAVAEAVRAKAEANRQAAAGALAKAATEPGEGAPTSGTEPQTPLDETKMGARQRQEIQEKLKALGLYTGPVDAILGPLSREAIMGYQRSRGAPVSGYLTAEQYDALLAK